MHAVEFLAGKYQEEIKLANVHSENRFKDDGTYDTVDSLVTELTDFLSNRKVKSGISNFLAKFALNIGTGSIVGASIYSSAGESPSKGAQDGALYTGLVDGVITMFLHKTANRYNKNPKPEEYIIDGAKRNYRGIMRYIMESVNNPMFSARNTTLEYIKSQDVGWHLENSADEMLGTFILYSGTASAVSLILPVPVLTVAIGGTVGTTIYKYFSDKKKNKICETIAPIMENLNNHEQDQLIGGLIKRWYG